MVDTVTIAILSCGWRADFRSVPPPPGWRIPKRNAGARWCLVHTATGLRVYPSGNRPGAIEASLPRVLFGENLTLPDRPEEVLTAAARCLELAGEVATDVQAWRVVRLDLTRNLETAVPLDVWLPRKIGRFRCACTFHENGVTTGRSFGARGSKKFIRAYRKSETIVRTELELRGSGLGVLGRWPLDPNRIREGGRELENLFPKPRTPKPVPKGKLSKAVHALALSEQAARNAQHTILETGLQAFAANERRKVRRIVEDAIHNATLDHHTALGAHNQ